MSSYKDYLIENDIDPSDKEGIVLLEKKVFRDYIKKLLDTTAEYCDEELAWFCSYAIPPKKNSGDVNECYFIYFHDSISGNYTNIKYTDRDEYIKGLLKAARISDRYTYNIFYYPSSYDTTKSKTAMACNSGAGLFTTLFFDLDDLDDIENVHTLEDIKAYMIEHYCINIKIFDAVCLSGHGLHLYKITEPMLASERTQIMEKWTAFLNADRANLPAAHYYRLPLSVNHKKNKAPVKSRFFIINKEPNKNISDFQNLEISEKELHAYKQEFDQKKAQKSLVTRRKNLYYNLEKAEKNGVLEAKNRASYEALRFLNENDFWDMAPSDYQVLIKKNMAENIRKDQEKTNKKRETPLRPALKTDSEDRVVPVTWEYHSINRDRNSIPQNLCLELENYLHRHNGVLSHRRAFVTIYVNYAKQFMEISECKSKIKQFVAESFYPTAESLIEAAFQTTTHYNYTFKKIADLLDFNEFDYEQSSPYFRHTFKEYQKIYKRSRYERKSDKSARDNDRKAIIQYIIHNRSISFQQFKEETGFSISKDTFYRYKKLIENGEPFTVCGQIFDPKAI